MIRIGNRVLVIGCCGAGKSVLSQRLADATGLPLIHLDREYWQPGWVEPAKTQWAAKVDELIAEPRWIIDGNYLGTLPSRLERADTVILLDPPRRLCLWRVMMRILRNLGRTRTDMALGCPERVDWAFLKYVWNFRRNHRPRVQEALRGFRGTLLVFRSAAEVDAFVGGKAV